MFLVFYIFVLPHTLVVTYMCLVWCSPEDGPRWLKHVVNVIIRKEYLCFISDININLLETKRFLNTI
jgi:hypothetical protein